MLLAHFDRLSAGINIPTPLPFDNLRGHLPFGQVRTNVTSPNSQAGLTDLSYTGQRDLGMGLMDYKARFYSPTLGRFTQPDTLIPGTDNPQAWNRFSYVMNSPILYNDPSGHKAVGDGENYDKDGNKQVPEEDPYEEEVNWGKFIAGDLLLLAGELTMIIGGVVVFSAYGEIVAGTAAAPTTLGLSEVIALIHAPAELAVGGLIFAVGAGMAYAGVDLMADSGVPAMVIDNLSSSD